MCERARMEKFNKQRCQTKDMKNPFLFLSPSNAFPPFLTPRRNKQKPEKCLEKVLFEEEEKERKKDIKFLYLYQDKDPFQ